MIPHEHNLPVYLVVIAQHGATIPQTAQYFGRVNCVFSNFPHTIHVTGSAIDLGGHDGFCPERNGLFNGHRVYQVIPPRFANGPFCCPKGRYKPFSGMFLV